MKGYKWIKNARVLTLKTQFKTSYIYFNINILGNVIYATITYVIVFKCIVYFTYFIVYNGWIAITFYATNLISMFRVKQKMFHQSSPLLKEMERQLALVFPLFYWPGKTLLLSSLFSTIILWIDLGQPHTRLLMISLSVEYWYTSFDVSLPAYTF